MKKLLSVMLLFSVVFTGCSNSNKVGPSLVCSYSEEYDGITTSWNDTYENNGSAVSKAIFETNYTAADEEDILYIKESMAYIDNSSDYDYDGITYEIAEIDNGVQVTIIFDLEVVSNDVLVDLGFISSDDKDAKYIDVNLTKESLESDGFTCSFDE